MILSEGLVNFTVSTTTNRGSQQKETASAWQQEIKATSKQQVQEARLYRYGTTAAQHLFVAHVVATVKFSYSTIYGRTVLYVLHYEYC